MRKFATRIPSSQDTSWHASYRPPSTNETKETIMLKMSPSRLDRVAACPRFVFDDRETKAMDSVQESLDAGINFHTIMEGISKDPENATSLIAAIPDFTTRRDAEWAWNHVRGILDAGGQIVGVESEAYESSVCRRGFIDLLIAVNGGVVIVDWKLVRQIGEHDLQLKAYAIYAFECCKLDCTEDVSHARVMAISPAIQHVSDVTYTRDQLPAMRADIIALMDKVENPFSPPVPGPVCTSCKWSGRCPAQCKELVPVSQEVSLPVAYGDLLNPSTPNGRARRRYFLDWLVKAVDNVKEDDLNWVKAGNEPPPGYKLVSMPGRTTLPSEALPQAIDMLASAGYSLDTIHGACSLSLTKLSAALAPVLGEDEKDLKKRLEAMLAAFTVTGQPSESLRRVSKKTMAELFKALPE